MKYNFKNKDIDFIKNYAFLFMLKYNYMSFLLTNGLVAIVSTCRLEKGGRP